MFKRIVGFFVCICLLLGLTFLSSEVASAAPAAERIVTTPTGYHDATDVQYNWVNGYIANWGARGEDCGFLSTYAQDFYTDVFTYSLLSQKSGGMATTAHTSPLYSALNTLMTQNHTYFTKYDSASSADCKKFYQYTDCMLGDPSYVSTIYRGLTVTGPWDGGKSYNQEHIWPKSKSYGSYYTDAGDLMQLRAVNPNENSSRNNTAYGESSGYYDPGVSVRGDCARTILYMYVRWGNPDYLWGTSGVMESMDVLLRWVREDPVDTWEMGHNDAVQSITGTRNVFVDYPEFAFLLFDQEIPSDMQTPSGGVSESGVSLVTEASALKAGDQIIIAALNYDFALSATQKTSNRAAAPVTRTGTGLNYGADTQVITLEAGSIDGTFAFSTGDSAYLYAASSSSNHLKTTASISDNASWSIDINSSTGAATIQATGSHTHNVMRYNATSSLFSCYAPSNSQKDVCIYRLPSVMECQHSYTERVLTAAACTTSGIRMFTCQICSDSYSVSVPATGHSYSGGACISCGAADPSVATETYYLFGYINGTNYACEESYQNLGAYKFVNGKLKATFNQDSYVGVKTSDNGSWYMTDGWLGTNQTTATLYNADTLSNANKLYVPGNVEVTFTVKKNANDTLTLSYTIGTCSHSYAGGVCTLCGERDPNNGTNSTVYYLFGYINGQDYASQMDAGNVGKYKFVDGKLTTTFNCGSYVAVKTADNDTWYMTSGWQGTNKTSVTLYETRSLSRPDKLFVPGGVQVTFTLVENSDGSLTLSYTTTGSGYTGTSTKPTFTLKYPTVSFEDMIVLNVYYAASNIQDAEEIGLITFGSKVTNYNINSADYVIPGSTWSSSDGYYYSSSAGIAAKNLGDTIYFAVYARLKDGTYTYSNLVSYSPKTYAYNQLKSGTPEMKALVVAMLNYGAKAQTYFGYKTNALVNADLTAEQKALVSSYSSSMMDTVPLPDTTKLGSMVNNGGYASRYPTISFEGVFCINYYFKPSSTPRGNITMYVWNQEHYNSVTSLSKNNATMTINMTKTSSDEYVAVVDGIAAKDLDKGVYVSFCYSDGTTNYCSGVVGYSIGTYCTSQASKTGSLAELAASCAVYGYYAKQMFSA